VAAAAIFEEVFKSKTNNIRLTIHPYRHLMNPITVAAGTQCVVYSVITTAASPSLAGKASIDNPQRVIARVCTPHAKRRLP
jgi:hypothetical protein